MSGDLRSGLVNNFFDPSGIVHPAGVFEVLGNCLSTLPRAIFIFSKLNVVLQSTTCESGFEVGTPQTKSISKSVKT